MTIEERQEAAKWFQNRAIHTTMPGAKMMFKRAAEALSEGMQPHWIPCSERLPDNDVEVFVYLFKHPSPYIVWVTDSHWYTDEFDIEKENEPIAWMPLPKPYGGDTK